MKGLSNEHVALLNKEDLIRIKGTLKRVYEKTGRQNELESVDGIYKGLEAMINAWNSESGIFLMDHCLMIAISEMEKNEAMPITAPIVIAYKLLAIVKMAIKEIDEFEFGCRCH
jgi:hypothetical protein